MPTVTVRNLDPETHEALKAIGAKHGRSMEAEARIILTAATRAHTDPEEPTLGSRIRARFADLEFEVSSRPDDEPRTVDFGA